jgi:hypothetical protein
MLKKLFTFFGRSPAPDEVFGDWLLTDRFQAFLDEPGPANYLKVRALVLADKAYRATSSELEDVELLLDYGRFADARERVRQMMPNWLLSPRAHQLAATAARHLGDEKAHDRASFLRGRCIEGILGTGDGTKERPYLVTHVDDEHDLVDHFGKKLAQQSLLTEETRCLDQIVCQDGAEIWFDLTDVHKRMDDPPKLSKARRPARAR